MHVDQGATAGSSTHGEQHGAADAPARTTKRQRKKQARRAAKAATKAATRALRMRRKETNAEKKKQKADKKADRKRAKRKVPRDAAGADANKSARSASSSTDPAADAAAAGNAPTVEDATSLSESAAPPTSTTDSGSVLPAASSSASWSASSSASVVSPDRTAAVDFPRNASAGKVAPHAVGFPVGSSHQPLDAFGVDVDFRRPSVCVAVVASARPLTRLCFWLASSSVTFLPLWRGACASLAACASVREVFPHSISLACAVYRFFLRAAPSFITSLRSCLPSFFTLFDNSLLSCIPDVTHSFANPSFDPYPACLQHCIPSPGGLL